MELYLIPHYDGQRIIPLSKIRLTKVITGFSLHLLTNNNNRGSTLDQILLFIVTLFVHLKLSSCKHLCIFNSLTINYKLYY